MYFSTGVCKCKYSLIYLDEIPMSKYTTLVKKKKKKVFDRKRLWS